MDYPLAIHRNRTALLAIVAGIVALLGWGEGGLIPRRLRNAALALLRPAEAAARRLIVIAARGLALAPRPRPLIVAAGGATAGARQPAFRLFDPPKRFPPGLVRPPPRGVPRIRTFGSSFARPMPEPVPTPAPRRPPPAALVDPAPLRRRLAALGRALADLPRQARRLARRRGLIEGRAGRRPHPLRPGRPPGWRARPGRAVDAVLRECHALALDVLADTS